MKRGQINVHEVLNAIDPAKLGPNSPLHELLAKRRRAPSTDQEHRDQVALFTWAAEHESVYPELRWLFAVPNFAGRLGRFTAKHGGRLKAEGRKKGVLDVWFPVRRGAFVGLVLEMKAGRNTTTIEQREWLAHLQAEGWSAHVMYGNAAAQEAIVTYLTLPKPVQP